MVSLAKSARHCGGHRRDTHEGRLYTTRSFGRLGLIPLLLVLVLTLLVVLVAEPNSRPFVSASAKPDAEILPQIEGEFMKAAAPHGSAGYMSYYADDAVELPSGAAIISDRKHCQPMGLLDNKNNHLSWTPVGADISASRDLGCTYGTYEFQSLGNDGKPIAESGN